MKAPTVLILTLTLTAALAACEDKKTTTGTASSASTTAASASAKPAFDPASLSALAALPKSIPSTAHPANDALVALGKMLFFEARLSKNQDISCNSCHKLESFGVDGEKTSTGHKKQLGTRNSPTVLNSAIQFRQFWDGRAADVEEQATGPIANPVEMASSEKLVVAVLGSMPEYVDQFAKAFPGQKDPISLKNIGVAIGAFERTLLAPSRFDKYLGGDKTALTDAELAGAALFVSTGCTACHNGAGIGGGMYQKAGLVKPWPSDKDLGRFTVTKDEADKMMFKVPSLRNVEKTAPYFHDGGTATLDEAVKIMGRHQLGRELADADVASIVTFLKTLTAPLPTDVATPPALPKSTPKTPKPDPG